MRPALSLLIDFRHLNLAFEGQQQRIAISQGCGHRKAAQHLDSRRDWSDEL